MTRMIVCGPRVGILARHVFQVLEVATRRLPEPHRVEVVEGAAACVDQAAGAWADRNAHAHWRFPINDWLDGEDPMTAPKNRNARMLHSSKASLCLGFPGHGGTNDMMVRAHDAGVTVWEVELSPEGGERPTSFSIRAWGHKSSRTGSAFICTGTLT